MSACALGVFDAALFFLRVYLIDDSTVKWSRSFEPVVLCEKFYVFIFFPVVLFFTQSRERRKSEYMSVVALC
jgi:hypothetical protein